MIQFNITSLISLGTLVSHILLLLVVILFFTQENFKEWVLGFVNKHVLKLLFVTSLSALVGSLLFSNVIGFPPCELCWIQRIFMYPQTVLLFMAAWWNDRKIVLYLLPLTALGLVVSLYHSLTHFGLGDGLVGCTSALGDCGKLYVFDYGYITIPLMSFTMFAYLFTISLIYFKSIKERI